VSSILEVYVLNMGINSWSAIIIEIMSKRVLVETGILISR
jgi:hypothetical protein